MGRSCCTQTPLYRLFAWTLWLMIKVFITFVKLTNWVHTGSINPYWVHTGSINMSFIDGILPGTRFYSSLNVRLSGNPLIQPWQAWWCCWVTSPSYAQISNSGTGELNWPKNWFPRCLFFCFCCCCNPKERDISFADELKMQNTRMSPPWGRNSIKGNSAAEKNEN